MRQRLVIPFLVLGLVIFWTALSSTAEDGKETLTAAAKEFWGARVNGDQTTLYEYLSSEERGELTQEQFVARMQGNDPFRYLSWKLGGVETAKNLGWVETESTVKLAKYPELPSRTIHRWQIWQKTGDRWHPLAANQEDQAPKLPPSLRPADEEAALVRRANEFWEAKEKADWQHVYQLCEPKFKDNMSSEEFLQKKALYSYLTHEVEWAEVAADHGRVRCTYTYVYNDPSLAKMDPLQGSLVDDWIKVEGVWYLKVKDSQ